MASIWQLIRRSQGDFGSGILLVLAFWSLTWPSSRAWMTMYQQHFQGGLCPLYISSTISVTSITLCAMQAQAVGAAAFSFCPDEVLNCAISSSSYPLGAWDSAQSLCTLFSSLLPAPLIPPPRNGTKRFVMSSSRASQGDGVFLEANGFCTSEGYEFAVISSVAEFQLANDQVGYEGTTGCPTGGFCAAWFNLDDALRWPDGSSLNQCEIKFTSTPSPGDCYESTSVAGTVYVGHCEHDEHYVLCQTFD
ncbi:C-type lectin fold [Trinorchestia longiramus]|nr:C-type lectin fold [Trinorchestia longiramus]